MSAPTTPERGPQWHNSYESCLSPEQLAWLHAALLDRVPHAEIIAKLPPWSKGPNRGQSVSAAALSGIYKRLRFRAAEQFARQSVKERAEREPGLTQAQLDEYGQRVFTEIVIMEQDLDGFVKLRRAQQGADSVSLDKARFRRESLQLFVEWAANKRALELAVSPVSNAEKIEQLGALMFGEDWDTKPEAKAA